MFSEVGIRKLIDIKLIADYITTRDKKRQCLDDWNPKTNVFKKVISPKMAFFHA